MKVVKEFREGSRQMGRQTLRVAVALTRDPSLAAYLDDVNADRTPGHHAIAFGMGAGGRRGGVAPPRHPSLAASLDDVNADRTPGHHAIAFGMVAGTLGWDAKA